MARPYGHPDVSAAKAAALEVLHHNAKGPYNSLPRTAGWGYPEPYTRDLMIASLGILAEGDKCLVASLGRVLESLANNQSELGHIPSLAHNSEDRGASDTTPLFLIALALYRKQTGQLDFLHEAGRKALCWMEYQSPSDRVIVAQQPTSDWRDEQWVLGFGLYVNTLVYTYLRLFGQHDRASDLKRSMNRFVVKPDSIPRHIPEGLVVRRKPYYATWSYKLYSGQRFDLLGNSLAVLSGVASRSRARALVTWVEAECHRMRHNGLLLPDLPPNFFPYVSPNDVEWTTRYEKFNAPGEYHNGGIWPFVCGFYIAAMVAARYTKRAERKLQELTRLVRLSHKPGLEFGFNEWLRAQDTAPLGQDWQTWSAAMYLYAAVCVETGQTPFFDKVRGPSW